MAVIEAPTADKGDASTEGGPMVAIHELIAGERRSVTWLLIILLIDFVGLAMLIPIVPFFLMEELGMGPSEVGILISANSLAQLIGASCCGRISDAVGRYPVIIVAWAWAGLGYAAMAAITTFLDAMVVRVFQGLSGGTAALADAYILDSVPAKSRPSYVGLTGAVKSLAFMLGPGIGAVLVVMGTGRRSVFLIAGGVTLMSSMLGLFFLEESLERSKRRPLCGSKTDDNDNGDKTWDAADWEAVNKELLCILFCRFWSAMGLGFLFATYAFLIKDNFGWSDAHFGIVLLVSGFFNALMQMLLFPRLVAMAGVPNLFFAGSILGVVAFALLPQPSAIIHMIALACFTMSGACVEPAFPLLIGMYVGDRHLGLANGVTASFRSLATIITPLVAGSLYELSAEHAYYTASGCFACCVVGAAVIIFFAMPKSAEADGLLRETQKVSA